MSGILRHKFRVPTKGIFFLPGLPAWLFVVVVVGIIVLTVLGVLAWHITVHLMLLVAAVEFAWVVLYAKSFSCQIQPQLRLYCG